MNAKRLALGFAAALGISSAWAQSSGPSGAHYANGYYPPVCSVDGTQSVSCTETVIGGVGKTNAVATLSATYSATVQCRNHGGQVVEVKTHTTEGTSSGELKPSRNGQLRVPSQSVTVPSDEDIKKEATCPNGNWTPEVRDRPTLVSYVYTITFVGYTEPFFSKVGP